VARRVHTAVGRLVDAGVRIVTSTSRLSCRRQLLYDGGLVSERYAAVGEFIDAHPDAAIDPTVRRIITAARDIPAHRLVRDRREVDRPAHHRVGGSRRRRRVGGCPPLRRIAYRRGGRRPRRRQLRMGTYTNFCNCSIFVRWRYQRHSRAGAVRITVLARAFEDAVALDIAALTSGDEAPLDIWPLAVAEAVELWCFGAHLRDGPLVLQLDRSGRPLGRLR